MCGASGPKISKIRDDEMVVVGVGQGGFGMGGGSRGGGKGWWS